MVEHVSDTVAIMYLGRIVERGPAEEVFAHPAHPYTRALMEAIPIADPEKRHTGEPVRGEAPSSMSPPPGCPFHPRCRYAIADCRSVVPPLEPVTAPNLEPASDHLAACIRKHEI